jgi:hypothetical protein
MRTIFSCPKLHFIRAIMITGLLIFTVFAFAQICANPATTIYGLSSNGGIYPITISNANVSSALTQNSTSGNSPSASNGLGYNPINGRFYYFRRNPGSSSPQEFVEFDPGTATVTVKASIPTSKNVHTGCVNSNGTGFYALDVDGILYYYSIYTNVWTTITSLLREANNNNVSNIIKNRTSGDIAIDGNGNLWILCSSNTQYGLYKLYAPLPITAQTDLVVVQHLNPNTSTPNGSAFAGICFNPTGQILLSTTDDKLYRMENNLSLTTLGTFNISGVGNDLTSCAFPLGVLPVKWENFTASLSNGSNVLLSWTVSSELSKPVYYIEHNEDGKEWQTIGMKESIAELGMIDIQTFTHFHPGNGSHHYRIRQNSVTGSPIYSDIRTVVVKDNQPIAIWPNPARNSLSIQIANGSKAASALLFDLSGKLVKEISLQSGITMVDVNSLKPGLYVTRITLSNGDTRTERVVIQP